MPAITTVQQRGVYRKQRPSFSCHAEAIISQLGSTQEIKHRPYPLSSMNKASQALSLRRSNILPIDVSGSIASNPSRASAFFASTTSRLANPSHSRSSGDLTITLSSDKSSAIAKALDRKELPSSSSHCFPADSHGTLNMYAMTISTERLRLFMTWFARFLQ